MKTKFVMVSMLVASNAMAFDFETEYSKFSSDFARMPNVNFALLDNMKVSKKKTVISNDTLF